MARYIRYLRYLRYLGYLCYLRYYTQVLKWLVLTVAEEPQRVFYRIDVSGAHPIHALLLANSPPALDLSIDLFRCGARAGADGVAAF